MSEMTERMYQDALAELRRLERENHQEGGFLSSDPRSPRMLDLGRQIDDHEAALMLAQIEAERT